MRKNRVPKPSQKVFDWQGNLRDLAYLQGKYGSFVTKPAAERDGAILEAIRRLLADV
jgi:hypothetical protein